MKSNQKNGALYLKQVSPIILACISIFGVIGTSIMTARATPKALQLIEENDVEKAKLSKKEIVQLTWKCYIPAAAVGLSTIACIVGISFLSKRNQASLASAYAALSQLHQQYQKAANTVYGEDADSKIKAQIAQDMYISADGYSVYSSDLDPESEKILCYDLYSQRYFTATMASVLNAQYHINRNLCLRGDASINEFYEFLGIDKIDHGDEIGWSIDELMEGGIMWLDFENGHVEMDDGMSCCVISALWGPDKIFC